MKYYNCRFCHGNGCLACQGEKLKADEEAEEWRKNKNPLSEQDAILAGQILDAINKSSSIIGEQPHPVVSFTKPDQLKFENGRYRDCPKCRGLGCVSCPSEADAEYNRQFPNGPQPTVTIKIDPGNPDAAMDVLKEIFKLCVPKTLTP